MACFKHGKHDTQLAPSQEIELDMQHLSGKKKTAGFIQYTEEKVSNSCTNYVIASAAKGHKHWH
jgi:hypothetical protein